MGKTRTEVLLKGTVLYNSNQEMNTYTIRLQKYDDTLTILDKISWSTTTRVILVFPDRSQVVFGNKDFARIQRFSKQKGFQTAVVIGHPEMREEAKKTGLVVFGTLDEAKKMGWKKPYSPNFEPGSRPAISEIKTFFKENKRSREPVIKPGQYLVSMVLVGLAVLALLLFFVPGAEVSIHPERQEESLAFSVVTSPQYHLMIESALLPARVETVQLSDQGVAIPSGEINIPSDYATGEIRINNLTPNPVTIPKGTIVMASMDVTKRYQILNDVTVDGNDQNGVTVGIKAAAPGGNFNADAGTVDAIESQYGLSVQLKNDQPVTGGKDSSVKSATEKDYDILRQKLLDDLSQKAIKVVQTKLQDGEQLAGSMVRVKQVVKEEKSVEAGQPADSISLNIEVSFEGWVIQAENLNQIAESTLALKIPDGYEAIPGTLKVENLGNPVSSEKDLTWKINAIQETRRRIEASRVRDLVTGKEIGQAEQEIQNTFSLKQSPSIQVFPVLWPLMPFYFMRINVMVD